MISFSASLNHAFEIGSTRISNFEDLISLQAFVATSNSASTAMDTSFD